jgi:Uma2 family endonuclease
MSTQPKPHLTPEQYLEIERAAEIKSEYFDGEMLAMSRATFSHVTIVDNLTVLLGSQLRGRRCRGAASDLRLRTDPAGTYFYPDYLVYCGKPQLADPRRDTLTDATVVIEVLSPSTERYDRAFKFPQYRRLRSFTDYLLIAQDRVHVEHKHRKSDGSWETIETSDPEAVIQLPSIECTLRVGDVYDAVEFEPEY